MLARNKYETCMFCDEAPCICNAKKKPAARKTVAKAKPKVEAPVEPKPEPIHETIQRKAPTQPPRLGQRKALPTSKKPLPTGPTFNRAKPVEVKTEEVDDELERVVRTLNAAGLLHRDEQRRHSELLKPARPTGRLAEVDASVQPGRDQSVSASGDAG